MRSTTLWTACLSALTFGLGLTQAVYLAPNDQQMFDESMNFMDSIYDPHVGYLRDFYGGSGPSAGTHVTRPSIWYAAGLLQRNQDGDYDEAVKIINAIVAGQHDDPSELWYGDYQVYPEEASVNITGNPQSPYGNWDPNWRVFIGNVMILIYEEFGDMLSDDVKGTILGSLYNVTLGDSYRTYYNPGGLVPAYSNPSIMRAIMASWTGRHTNDQNLTDFGENWASLFIENFDLYDTLPEFNSGTYSGVSIWALTLWAKYSPDDSVLKTNGTRILKSLWHQLSQSYNANLRNLAGPWDRSYGYDMNLYYAIMSTYIWSFVGKDLAPVQPKSTWAMAHADDFEYTPVIAILADFHNSLIDQGVKDKFKCFPDYEGGQGHWYNSSVLYPPRDQTVRNITTWNSPNLTIGAESYRWNQSTDNQFNPAVVQWSRYDGSVGYMNLYPTERSLDSKVGTNWLDLTYPEETNATAFSFVVSTNSFYSTRNILSLADVSGVNITVGGNVDPTPQVGFCGQKSGTCKPIHGFEFWNYTFVAREASSGPLNIHLTFELEQ